ncbi:hypothetical protein J3E74DRAFT_470296 [Bipolaris maydis]|nr:hypothetical protein J3E74DRAFT_470296 [Bipolaris maydis]
MFDLRKRLKKLKRKELAPEKPLGEHPSQVPAPVTEHQDRYGLFLLNENTLPDDSKDNRGVDIVAIHGLNGNAYTTWEHENGTLWLRDLLQRDLPGSRIYTYGYPSELFWSNSVAKLRDYSGNLLSSLAAVPERRQRPIIFVCHSLGGIVCKQALVLAHENDHLYGDTISAFSAIVFFGTPHRGSTVADVGKMIGRVVNMCMRASLITGISGSIRDDLLTILESNSQALNDLAVSSRNRLRNLEIVTFYETEMMPGLSELVVHRGSAIMEIPCEEVIPLYANHRTMCRFGGATDGGYICTLNVIKRLAKTALLNREMARKVDRTSSNQSLSETERSCMVLLNSIYLAEYKAQLPRPVKGTCSWILTHPAYLAWLTTEETKLLWITGEPGCGKTMLSAYLTDHLRLDHATSVKPQVFFFFCDDKVKSQRDANAILRGILYQIVQQHRKLIKYVKSRFEIDGPSLANSFQALWELFLKIVANSTAGAVRVIVDAIDECEVRTRNSFLNAIAQLVHESQDVYRQSRNCVKFLITSRPSLGNSYNLTGLMKNRIPIEEDQGVVSEDVKLVIRSKVGDIAKKFNCDDETRNYLEQVLYSKSDQSFLWLNMVLHSLETSSKASKRDFERIIDTFPQSLEATYNRFLRGISVGNREDAGKILRLLVGCSRHLTLLEINTAFSIDQYHKSIADVANDLQLSISTTLQNVVGSFVRIRERNQSSNQESQVSLVHQSAKEYLTDLALRSSDRTYLLLEEFQLDIFASERTSLGTNSPESYGSFPLNDFDTIASDGPLGLDDHLGLENFFKNSRELDEEHYEEQCVLAAQKYKFFDYAATHWAEHYSLSEDIAPKSVHDAAKELTTNSSCVLTNWLKYYWFMSNMEYSFPDVFEAIEVAAFFNLSILLIEIIEQAEFDSDARKNSGSCMKVLLQHGANPNGIGIDRQTPLTISAQYGNLDAVQILLDEPSTDVTFGGKSGRSALSFAAGNGHLEIVEILLKHGAVTSDDQDSAHWTPLFWAVIGDHANIVQLLLKQPSIDINQIDKHGRSVLSWAAGEGARRALKVLLQHPSIDLNLRDIKGLSPLLWAARNNQKEVNKCGGEDDVDIDGWTPLLWALFNESPATVETLLSSRRVQIDRQDSYGRTALIWAASYGYLDVVQLLVSWKANLLIKNQGGHCCCRCCKDRRHTEVGKFLEAEQNKEI